MEANVNSARLEVQTLYNVYLLVCASLSVLNYGEHDTTSQGELRRRAKRAKEEGPAKQSPSSCKFTCTLVP